MSESHDGMDPQPKRQALGQAEFIKAKLQGFEGQDLGFGLVYNKGALIHKFDETSPYFLDENREPLTLFHYRNLSSVTKPGNADFHDLMHFGTLRAAYSRAFSKRLSQNGQMFSEQLLNTEVFNKSASLPIGNAGTFGEESLFAVNVQAKKPFFIPDIGQSFYFRNRAVLYACGLFEESDVDDLFDEEDYPLSDIDQQVMLHLRERGYDSVAYLNYIEDPGSLSLLILDKNQLKSVQPINTEFPGVRYRFGPREETKIVEYNGEGNVQIISDLPEYGIY